VTPNNKKNRSWFAFSLVMLFILIVASLYFYNIFRWANEPEWGFIFRSGSAIDIIGGVREKGHEAGLQSGDRLLSINGKKFQTVQERRAFRNYGLGEKNTYVIERGSDRLEVTIINTFAGFWKSFKKCGFPYVVGLSYVFIGVLIFLMKPHRHDSWVFLIFATCLGLLMGFLLRGGVLKPSWLNTIHIFLYSFTPGAIIHLALSVPVKRNLIVKHPLVEFLPYVASLLLFIGIRSSAYEMQAVSRTWYLILLSYFVPALLVFILSCLHLWLRSSSVIARVRAQAILFGASIAASVPILDMVFSNLFKIYFVPSLNYYLPFLIIFPLSIGYALVKHNLFDIAAAIRRTYGYVLLTASIVVLYFFIIVILSSLFGDLWQKKSHFLFLSIVIVVMLSFSFLRKRLQTYVDRIFFRMDFNYQETVEKIGAAMRSLINLEQIVAFMKDICENVLFAGTSYVMLLNRNKNTYESVSAPSMVPALSAKEPLIQNIARQKREVVRYNIDEDPLFAIDREACRDTFKRLGASLIVPLIYEDHLAGFMALGEKKSGRFYRYEDILLLKTMTNQGAVALENARLFAELEQQTDMLTKTNIQLEEEVNQRKKAEAQLEQYRRQLEERVEKQNVELQESRKAMADLRRNLKMGYRFRNIIGKSEAMQEIYALIKDLTDVSATVLITGESGTGKELVAEALHYEGNRRDKPFVKVNCSALSESILESELFGHIKGAFTGADKDKIGRFQKAGDGTIFLDEIGDITPYFQKRLLRVLQEKEFEQMGDTNTKEMKARVLAATNQDLLEKVKRGEFRRDLYYRLRVVEINLPALRDRKEDIPILLRHFLQYYSSELGKDIKDISEDVLKRFMEYPWPGNIRELKNTLENVCILCKHATITLGDLPADFGAATRQEPLSSMEAADTPQAIKQALEEAKWNKTRAAGLLGISRRTLYRKLKEYHMIEDM
jgi:transcriptional regulator with GAF, ATPase, and Fis domain